MSGPVALAPPLVSGVLGFRDLAGEVTRAWYERWRAERDAIAAENERDDFDAGSGTRG